MVWPITEEGCSVRDHIRESSCGNALRGKLTFNPPYNSIHQATKLVPGLGTGMGDHGSTFCKYGNGQCPLAYPPGVRKGRPPMHENTPRQKRTGTGPGAGAVGLFPKTKKHSLAANSLSEPLIAT